MVTVVRNNAVRTEEGKISRGAGYSITLLNGTDILNTDFNVAAGEDRLFERVASPRLMQKYYRFTPPSPLSTPHSSPARNEPFFA